MRILFPNGRDGQGFDERIIGEGGWEKIRKEVDSCKKNDLEGFVNLASNAKILSADYVSVTDWGLDLGD